MASVIPFDNSMTVTAHVRDEAGNPAAGAIVKIWTDKDQYQGLARSPLGVTMRMSSRRTPHNNS